MLYVPVCVCLFFLCVLLRNKKIYISLKQFYSDAYIRNISSDTYVMNGLTNTNSIIAD